ncbi:MAG: membrane protein [Methanosaeta sp. NSM2]|nr:MAG: membrane protein [Methanosaeta sp. NSM2]
MAHAKSINQIIDNNTIMDFADIYPFIVALLIGALIGTERQRRMIEDKVRGVAGLRTFILIALLGCLCSALAEHYGSGFAIAGMATFTILAAVGYATSVSALGRVDFTAAVATVVTFALGMLAGFPDNTLLAVALSIITTWVLATRSITHRYVEALSETDLLDTLKMGIIALVIYPFLPETTLDPWGVLNPRQVWLFVVMVSLIGYVGYILIRILGAERGLGLTGVLGGLVSSTAVASSMAAEVRENRKILPSAVFATAIASCTMFPRILFIVLVVNRELFLALLLPMLLMTLVGFVLSYLLVRKSGSPGKDMNVKDPFRIIPALEFGAFFAMVLVISKLASIYFGDAGVYAAGVVSGLAETDAIALTMASLAGSTLTGNVAANTIILATITNTLVKLTITYVMGTREFGLQMAKIFLPTILVGLATLILI